MPRTTRTLVCRVPNELAAAFERVAVENDRSYSRELQRVIRAHVQAHESDGPGIAGPSATAEPVVGPQANGSG